MSVVNEIKARLDIVEVVSGYLTLQSSGRNYKAKCPFHVENTPSFIVNPDRQNWHCFGACSTGGDAFSFVMRMEKLEFGDSLRLLAEKTGVELSQENKSDSRETIFTINHEAARFYQENLISKNGLACLEYLKERGVDKKTADLFQVGASPNTGDALKSHLETLGFDIQDAVAAGLLRTNPDGQIRDFFWGRLMFPIHDRRGRIAGFGGRTLDGSNPKYINTAATSVFDKKSILYGLDKSVDSIRKQDTAIIVEGYMDVITAHQFEHQNVIASMGTALTEQQVSLIRSSASTFVLALDPDTAGQEATLRSLESAWRIFEHQKMIEGRRSVGTLYRSKRLDLNIAILPVDMDPDKLLRDLPEQWEQTIENAIPFLDFAIQGVASKYDLTNYTDKATAAEQLLPLITATDNAFEQERLFRKLARVLDVSESALHASIGNSRNSKPIRTAERTPTNSANLQTGNTLLFGENKDALEEYTLHLLIEDPNLWKFATEIKPEYFRRTENREVFTSMSNYSTIEEIREGLDDSLIGHLEYLIQISSLPTGGPSTEIALSQSIRRLEQRHLREMQESLLNSDDASLPPSREMEDRIVSVNARLKELFSK